MADRCFIQLRTSFKAESVAEVMGIGPDEADDTEQKKRYWEQMSIETGEVVPELMDKYILVLPLADKLHPSVRNESKLEKAWVPFDENQGEVAKHNN